MAEESLKDGEFLIEVVSCDRCNRRVPCAQFNTFQHYYWIALCLDCAQAILAAVTPK